MKKEYVYEVGDVVTLKKPPPAEARVGDLKSGGRLSPEVSGVRTSDYDRTPDCREKHERFKEKGLKQAPKYDIMLNRDT